MYGSKYELQTLTCFQRRYDHHLCQMGKSYSIISDKAFERSQAVLESKRKGFRCQSNGQKPNKAQAQISRLCVYYACAFDFSSFTFY